MFLSLKQVGTSILWAIFNNKKKNMEKKQKKKKTKNEESYR